MPSFLQTTNPTPFGFFNSEAQFQSQADGMVTYVKRSLGDDILSVELTSKQIWSCFEEATLEYARRVHEMRTINDLVHVLGLPTGSTILTNSYIHKTFEFINRMAEPYSVYTGAGGAHNVIDGVITLETGRQDYDLYTEMTVFSGSMSGSLVVDTIPSGSHGKLTVLEVMHFEPSAGLNHLLNSSNITEFLANEMNYESFTAATAFYVYPVFEDVLRRQMLETSMRIRRSNFTYRIVGSKLRIYPIPNTQFGAMKLFVRVFPALNPLANGDPDDPTGLPFVDETIFGVSGPNNIPFGIIPFTTITEPGRQWIRQYTLALCKEVLGLVRSKFDHIPVPNAEVRMNGSELIQQGREDKSKLMDQLLEFLNELRFDKIVEREANIAENLNKQLRFQTIPLGKAITIGILF